MSRPSRQVQELTSYLERFKDSPSQLTDQELRLIAAEISRCRRDFVYFAENYLWLSDKRGRDVTMRLWDTQWLILEAMEELRRAGRPQRLVILKSRQLGCSTLVEALITWKVVFYRNQTAVIVSYDEEHTSKILFGMVLNFIDRLPWWMRPMEASREIYGYLLLANPDPKTRDIEPGNNSRVIPQAATRPKGVGQGMRVTAAHISELCDFEYERARQIIEGDLAHALVESPETFAVIESTGKNAGSYFHEFWSRQVELWPEAEWCPRFFPWFMDKSHFIAPPHGWQPSDQLLEIRRKVSDTWLACERCGRVRERYWGRKDLLNKACPVCHGKLRPYVMLDGQLYWWERKWKSAGDDPLSQRELLQEQALTPSDAFQASNDSAFGQEATNKAAQGVTEPGWFGFVDQDGEIHVIGRSSTKCVVPGCDEDHRGAHFYIRIWELPSDNGVYYIGSDVASGLGGSSDYSAAVVLKVLPGRLIQVATARANDIVPTVWAKVLAALGYYYNEAEIAVEVNQFDSCASELEYHIQYPNLFQRDRRRHHWVTTKATKEHMAAEFKAMILGENLVVRSSNLLSEMRSVSSRGGRLGAPKGHHDDELVAAMIATICSKTSPEYSYVYNEVVTEEELSDAEEDWKVICEACGKGFQEEEPFEATSCPYCGCRVLARRAKAGQREEVGQILELLEAFNGQEND